MNIKAALALLVICCALGAGAASAQMTPIKPGAIPGKTLHFTNLRHYAFCEFYLGFGKPDPKTQLEIYNTTGTTGPNSGCPAATFAALDMKKLAVGLGATVVIPNPTVQKARKWWVMDELYLYSSGETYNFSGVSAIWVGRMGLGDLKAAAQAAKTPYMPLTNTQLTQWVFKSGSTVFLLRAPAGKVYVMQAVTNTVDPDLTYTQLPQLGSRLKKLPPGWTYDVKQLTKDLTFDLRNATPVGFKHLTLDEFGNVYLGCGFDSACNYLP
jgi:hypothetical protein